MPIQQGVGSLCYPGVISSEINAHERKLLHNYPAHLSFMDLMFKIFPSTEKLRKYLSRFDVIHATGLTSFMLKVIKNSDKPVVYTLATTHSPGYPGYREILDNVDVLVYPSRFVLEHEIKTFPDAFSNYNGKLLAIPWGVNTDLFNPSIPKSLAGKRLKLQENQKVVLWNSRMSPEKGFETLVEAIRLVGKRNGQCLILR